MHAVLVQVTIHDFDAGREALTSQIVPQVSQAPGFVAGYWVHSDQSKGHGMIVFESEEQAQNVGQMVQSGQGPDADFVTIDSVEVCEVVANA